MDWSENFIHGSFMGTSQLCQFWPFPSSSSNAIVGFGSSTFKWHFCLIIKNTIQFPWSWLQGISSSSWPPYLDIVRICQLVWGGAEPEGDNFLLVIIATIDNILIIISLNIMIIMIITITIIIVIIITRPKPAYGRQGQAGSWGQDTDQAGIL